jgi:predicted PurR-regulated permease PerM
LSTGAARPDREAERDQRAHEPFQRAATYSLRFLLIAAAATVLGYILTHLSVVVLPVLIALLLTALLDPAARWLRGRGVPRILATTAVILGSLVVVVGLLASIVPAVVAQAPELGAGIRAGVERVTTFLVEGPLGISQAEIDQGINRALEQVRNSLGGIATQVLAGAGYAANGLAQALLTLIVLFFFVNDGDRIWNGLVGLLQPALQADAHALGRRAFNILKSYVRGVVAVAVADSLLIGLALWAIGVPLVLPLVVLTFVGAFFPLIGAVVAGAMAVLVALVSNGLIPALLVLLAVVIVQQVEGNLLYPLVVGSSLELHPLMILLALAAGTALAGVVGALLAVPVSAVASGTAFYVRERRHGQRDATRSGPGPPSSEAGSLARP